MKRRTFVQTSIASLCTAAAVQSVAAEPKPKTGELYELRVYQMKPGKQKLLDEYLSTAFIPALKRFGIGPVGVFEEKGKDDQLKVIVLIVFQSADQLAGLSARLAADDEYQKAGAEYLAAKAADPVYARIQSSLLQAIEGMPKLEKPDTSKPRLLNLRIYQSHNERAGKKKIEMFNKGELAIFKRVGLTPVLFGEAIVGGNLPNLTYLLVFPDDAGRAAAWGKFVKDDEWIKLKSMPEYSDKEIVSGITNIIMTPTSYSEI
jgi:hypothetical protein